MGLGSKEKVWSGRGHDRKGTIGGGVGRGKESGRMCEGKQDSKRGTFPGRTLGFSGGIL